MSNETRQSPTSPEQLLARSLFPLAFIALLFVLGVGAAMVLSPLPPDPTFARTRTIILIGYGVFTLIVFGMVVALFRISEAQLETLASRLRSVLSNRWLMGILLFLLIEANFIAQLTLVNVAPAITNPAKVLLFAGSLLFVLLVLAANWSASVKWLSQTQPLWASFGIAIVVLLALFALNWVNSRIVRSTGIADTLRGSLDYRRLIWFNEGENAQISRDFWIEQNQMKARWTPYVYWTLEPYSGKYINVNAEGIRASANFVDEDADVPRIHFYGGSTAWGEGARDDYTIPSHINRLLHEAGQDAYITNYGQTGYVSTQDMLTFQSQLMLGNIPDVAIYYQGFNDTLSGYEQNWSGLAYFEGNRYSDFYAGRLLSDGEIVLRRPNPQYATDHFALYAERGGDAVAIIDRWLSLVKMSQNLAHYYGVQLVVVWQPAIFYKQTLLPAEQVFRDEVDVITPGFADLYIEADKLLRERIEQEHLSGIVLLSDLFADDTTELFYDRVHVNEVGNYKIAQAILPAVEAALAIRN